MNNLVPIYFLGGDAGFDVNKMFHYIVAVKGGKCTVEELAKGLNINEELIPEFVMKRGSERMKFIKADDPRKVKS